MPSSTNKIGSPYDQVTGLPTGGYWTWKEETNTLEYVSIVTNADKGERKRDRRQAKDGKKLERAPTKIKGIMSTGLQMPKSPVGYNKKQEPQNVTLQHVKAIALSMLHDREAILPAFHELFQSEQCDTFLIYLMNYFESFFEKRAREKQPEQLSIEPSMSEKRSYADLVAKLAHAQKLLGQAYGALVLGIGTEPVHHMSCGHSRVSKTAKDRNIYETIYAVCEFVIWITFRRKEEYDVIHKEMGRMLRSQTFAPISSTKKLIDEDIHATLTPAEYRRQFLKRPAIKSIITQRSPALISILPTTKENANFLFKKQEKQMDALTAYVQSNMRKSMDLVDEALPPHLDPNSLRIGIIGEPLKQFNAITLTPLGVDVEVDAAKSVRKDSASTQATTTAYVSGALETAPSRLTGVTSRATSEAVSDSLFDGEEV